MKYTPVILREILRSLIRKLGETPEQFARRPGRDFTRPRTLSFETVISLLLTMSENSIGKALITDTEHKNIYKAAIALSPTNKELAEALEWPYDAALINIPIMLISGEGGGDDWVVTGEGLTAIYDDISADKVMLRRKNTDHGKTQYSEDGYVMAWFMWQLQGDENAAKAFAGDGAEILTNPLYQDQRIAIK